jgi:hypothetical protein
MFAWVGRVLAAHAVQRSTPLVDNTNYIEEVRRNIADIRTWLAEVEARLPRTVALAEARQAPPPTATVDEEIRAADSPTRVQKALEREFKVDRRTIYAYVERIVEAYGMAHKYADWRTDTAFWKQMAARDASGKTTIERGLISLGSKAVAA